MSERKIQKLGKVIWIDEDLIKQQVGEMVLGTPEDGLNKLLDIEADKLYNTIRYKRSDAWQYTGPGIISAASYQAGGITLKISSLHPNKFEMAVIERYKHRINQRRGL